MTDKSKASQQIIKDSNLKLVFGLIHSNNDISRADIKKITGLSATTVSTLVEELISDGFVSECGMKKNDGSGRRAVMLKINSNGGCFIGLDVRKNRIDACCYGLDFEMVDSISLPVTEGEKLAMTVMHAVGRLSRNKKILGVTIGLPGLIDPMTNTLVSSTVLQKEDATDIYYTLKNAMKDAGVYLKNNSGLIALAEKEFGNHERPNNLISIDIDDGVGAGVLIDGKIYDGNGMAGEFGHISVDFNGDKCKCGSYGCLELYASVPAILDQTGCDTLETLRCKLQNCHAARTFDVAARALAFGINNIVNLLDPELIVIGGSITLLGDVFLNSVRDTFKNISLIKEKAIVFSEITENPVALGGARYAFDRMFGL